ncbi:hypothetical protein EDB83DRAFT_1872455 [Lactarius deliciosus]|nr:hypothetical protein EDB83DRAFT_1872455 [Lactarius deliciosus]
MCTWLLHLFPGHFPMCFSIPLVPCLPSFLSSLSLVHELLRDASFLVTKTWQSNIVYTFSPPLVTFPFFILSSFVDQ